MKIVSRLAIISITITLLLSLLILPVNAKDPNNKPDPHFKRSETTYIDTSYRPYYGKKAVVDTYFSDGLYYSVDTTTGEMIEIFPQRMNYKTDGTLSEQQLKNLAQRIVAEFLGEKVDIGGLVYTLGSKEGTFFFRWESSTGKIENGSSAYIQIGLSNNGDFLNFINTLPYEDVSASTEGQTSLRPMTNSIQNIGQFNEIYANDGTKWSRIGSMSSATGGYCYIAGWCQPTTYRYKAGNSSGGTWGTWTPNSNTDTKAAVFIPSTNATALANYQITLGAGHGTTSYQVDQNAWYNSWVSITVGPSGWGIVSIALENRGSSSKIFAWDEAWVYNP